MIFLMRGGSTESSRDSSAPSASLGCGPTGCSGAVRVSF